MRRSLWSGNVTIQQVDVVLNNSVIGSRLQLHASISDISRSVFERRLVRRSSDTQICSAHRSCSWDPASRTCMFTSKTAIMVSSYNTRSRYCSLTSRESLFVTVLKCSYMQIDCPPGIKCIHCQFVRMPAHPKTASEAHCRTGCREPTSHGFL